ncbi:hypothetical protein [Nocardia alni]|uniref:hypothetical protein n=1 Tax=Nocardia alni TaxID=2815723 RepID=UPI001C215109|nr:hypothetical protein [Nocardia alni]
MVHLATGLDEQGPVDRLVRHITYAGLRIWPLGRRKLAAGSVVPLYTWGPAWTTEPYTLSRGNKSLLTVYGGEHFLGGISGYEVAETTDENHGRVALIQHVTLASLHHVTEIDHTDWRKAESILTDAHPVGRLESK